MKTKKQEVVITTDEHPRPQTTPEGLAKLSSIFKKDGLVTAGSASVRNAILTCIYLLHSILNLCFIYYKHV